MIPYYFISLRNIKLIKFVKFSNLCNLRMGYIKWRYKYTIKLGDIKRRVQLNYNSKF